MWANALGFQGWDLFRRNFRITVEEQWPARISPSDAIMQFSHRLFPERTKPNFPAFAMNLHRTGSY
jgi:hypothetical protein